MKLKFWCATGFNNATHEGEFDFADLGLTQQEWLEMQDEEKGKIVFQWVIDQGVEWGWQEVEE